MRPVEIAKGVYWAGVVHPETGASDNSCLIAGSESTAVAGTVKDGFFKEHIEKLSGACDVSSIGYIIINHVEPDHCGGLFALLQMAPGAAVVCTKPAAVYLGSLIDERIECRVVEDGDSVALGGKTLTFISVPNLPWPDTMMTYIVEDAVLLAGGLYGSGACAENVFDDMSPAGDGAPEKAAFDAAFGPFKAHVRAAVKKTRALHIDMIIPSRGPVLRSDPWGAVDRFEKWAAEAPNDPKMVYIGYASRYGFTRALAERIARAVAEGGCDAVLEDMETVDAARCAGCIHAADAFAIGAPTLNRDVPKPVWDVLTSLSVMLVQGKAAAAFGSFGWSGEALKYMSERLRALGADVVGTCSAKLKPSNKELAEADRLGAALCTALGERAH